MYAVTVMYNFDAEVQTCLFDSEKDAIDYLHKDWQYCFNEEIAESTDLNYELTYHEDYYAVITWNSTQNDRSELDKMEFVFSEIVEPIKF